MHPNAIIAIAASANCEKLTQEIFGGEMAYVKWMRPGFELGLAMQEIVKSNPKATAIMMGQHGFISWANDDKECYLRTLDFIEKASQYIEAKYQAKGGDAKAFGGAEISDASPRKAPRGVRRDSAVAARPGFAAETLHRHGAGRREDFAFRELRTTRRAWPNSARAAPTIFCARKSSRFTSRGIRRPRTRRR